jgi:hypothetical protein
MAKRPTRASMSGAARSTANKVGTVARAKTFSKGRSKTSSQIAAARRNIEKARQAIKRKAGGTAALRLKVGAKRLVSKVKAKAIGLRTRVRKMMKG